MSNTILEQPTFREWFKAGDQAFYDDPHEVLTKALFRIGRIHTPHYNKLYTFERRYINQQVNHSYGF